MHAVMSAQGWKPGTAGLPTLNAFMDLHVLHGEDRITPVSVSVIVVAAGRGVRAGGETPKQLLDLGGQTMLQRSVAACDAHPDVDELVVVLPAEWVAEGPALVGATRARCHVVAGGARRQDSVRAGFAAVQGSARIVLVHDAARPFVSRDVIDR